MGPQVRIGCSGWSYEHWVGPLYPEGTPKGRWRDLYAARFDTLELNASFYRWPGVRPFEGWSRSLPDGFAMTVKASRWISHARRLRDPDGAWADRLAAAHDALGARAGQVLVQLPADLARDDDLLDAFLARVPDRVPVALELRHPSWAHDDVDALLARHRAAYVVTHGIGTLTREVATAPHAYLRLHGPDPERPYAGRYPEAQLRHWAALLLRWRAEGRTAWCYLNNDLGGAALHDAERLRTLVREGGGEA